MNYSKHIFAIFLKLRILISYQNILHLFTKTHVTYEINTKLHICSDIARQSAPVRYEDVFNSTLGFVVSFLITDACNLSCYIKQGVVLYI